MTCVNLISKLYIQYVLIWYSFPTISFSTFSAIKLYTKLTSFVRSRSNFLKQIGQKNLDPRQEQKSNVTMIVDKYINELEAIENVKRGSDLLLFILPFLGI